MFKVSLFLAYFTKCVSIVTYACINKQIYIFQLSCAFCLGFDKERVNFFPLSNTSLGNIIRCSRQHVACELRVERD